MGEVHREGIRKSQRRKRRKKGGTERNKTERDILKQNIKNSKGEK
jgi:hypothetical protein